MEKILVVSERGEAKFAFPSVGISGFIHTIRHPERGWIVKAQYDHTYWKNGRRVISEPARAEEVIPHRGGYRRGDDGSFDVRLFRYGPVGIWLTVYWSYDQFAPFIPGTWVQDITVTGFRGTVELRPLSMQ